MRGHSLLAVVALAAAVGFGAGRALMPYETDFPRETAAPYCMVDREVPEYLTVAGPADGVVTVDGDERATLVLVDADVADEAGPYDGIVFNVPGPGVVAVDDQVCEST